MATTATDTGRSNQKKRTRAAIVEAARELIGTGAEVTMPTVARAALVSEATAYRYFPDLPSLISEALAGAWPAPADALRPVAGSRDAVERTAFACEFLLRGVLARQGAVRAMIAATITRPETVPTRPGIRFGLIDHALAPLGTPWGRRTPGPSPSSSGIWRWSSARRPCSPSPTCAASPPTRPSPAPCGPRPP